MQRSTWELYKYLRAKQWQRNKWEEKIVMFAVKFTALTLIVNAGLYIYNRIHP